MPDDPLTDLWRALARILGNDRADVELLQLRARWGGQRIYFKKPADWPETRADRDSVKCRPK